MAEGFMRHIQWLRGKPYALGLHRKSGTCGWNSLMDDEKDALRFERDWHSKYDLTDDQYTIKFKNGGGVGSLPEAPTINKVLQKGIANTGYVPNFIKRAINPEGLSVETEGQPSTVRMMTTEVDGVHYAHPSIFPIETPMGPALTQLDGKKAAEKAFSEGEYLKFDNAEEADFFAKNFTKEITRR